MSHPCPCCSNDSYDTCCGPYILDEKTPPTPLELMRSRYTAFTNGTYEYLLSTWHPETRPDSLDQDEPNNWVGLEIVEWGMDDEEVEGEVEFIARLVHGDTLETLHEVSSFDRIDGKWLYHSGEFKNEHSPQKISMKTPCPCGSGEKFKHCHYQKN